MAIDGPCGLNEKSRENDSTFILIASTARYLNSNRGNLSWNWKHLFYPFYRIFFLNIRRRGQSWLVEDWILERCEDLTKKTSKRKFVPVSFCLEIKEKFYRENRGIDARRKRSWDGVFFATNRSVGKRLRMARWHLTFSPFFHHPRRPRRFLLYPFAGCFKPEQYDWIIEAHTASSGYRLEVKSLRGMEAERHLEVCIPKMDFDIWPSPPGILIERVDFTHEITLCATHCEYFQLPFAGHVHTPKRLKNWTVHSVYFS